ncbi:MAG TPA: hypothetical protein DDW52_02160 [Planctomycetaceae bacterium]|nr:hypothetical protein [Planctomycetaceae bacterium]
MLSACVRWPATSWYNRTTLHELLGPITDGNWGFLRLSCTWWVDGGHAGRLTAMISNRIVGCLLSLVCLSVCACSKKRIAQVGNGQGAKQIEVSEAEGGGADVLEDPAEAFAFLSGPSPAGLALVEEARRTVSAARAALPRSVAVRKLEAALEFEFGAQEVARELWIDVLADSPEDPVALERLAQYEIDHGQHESAAEYLERALAALPDNFELILLLAKSQRNASQLDAAKATLEKSISEVDTKRVDRRLLAEVHFELASICCSQGEQESAAENWRESVGLFPDYREAHLALARYLARRGEAAAAREHLVRYRELQSKFVDERESGRETYDDDKQNARDIARLYTELASVFLGEAHSDVGVKLLERAAAICPSDIQSRRMLAWEASQAGRAHEATKWLQSAADQNLDKLQCQIEAAQAEVAGGLLQQAEHRLAKYVQAYPQDVSAKVSLARFFLSVISKPREAVNLLESVTSEHPTSENYELLSAAYVQAGERTKALASIDRAVSLDPHNSQLKAVKAMIKQED